MSSSERNDGKKETSVFKQRVFVQKNSILTDLYEVHFVRQVYRVVLGTLLVLCLNKLFYNLIYERRLHFEDNLIYRSFKGLPTVAFYWLMISAFNLFMISLYVIWNKFLKINNLFMNYLAVVVLIVYYYCTLKLTTDIVVKNDLPCVPSMILLTEQIRLIMKAHSFIRECTRVTGYTPTLGKYLYFLFIPTLIFREEYPRTKFINWRKFFEHFRDVIACLVSFSILFETYYLPVCEKFSANQFNLHDVFWVMLNNALASGVMIFLANYLILHAWMNAFAELFRFADREFYQDWWNCTDYTTFYRKWNLVVHDWLYAYIFIDGTKYVTRGNTKLAKLLVFLISAVVHEYIITFTGKMFYPALFIQWTSVGVSLTYVKAPKTPLFNILFLYGYSVGVSIAISAYVIEYCARSTQCSWHWYQTATFSNISC